jgi:hypothetical protein
MDFFLEKKKKDFFTPQDKHICISHEYPFYEKNIIITVFSDGDDDDDDVDDSR